MSLWPPQVIHAGERHEGKQRPLIIVGRDQAPTATTNYREIFCRAIYPATSFSAVGEIPDNIAGFDPVYGLNRSDPTHQSCQFWTGRLGHSRQVGERK
jgi:hypothetical protein